jgi:hypothetical protein
MKNIKGELIKIESSCWSDDRGNDKFGYAFYLKNRDKGFSIDKKSINGKFFHDNKDKLLNTIIEFTCDDFGYNVKFSKQFKKLIS